MTGKGPSMKAAVRSGAGLKERAFTGQLKGFCCCVDPWRGESVKEQKMDGRKHAVAGYSPPLVSFRVNTKEVSNRKVLDT